MRLLLLIIIAYLGYRIVKSWLVRTLKPPGEKGMHDPKIDDVMIKDPVCGIYFPRRQGVELRQGGQVYLFCSDTCRDRFVERQKK